MLKKLLFLTITGLLLSGCFMAPMALIGPATSGFSTASIIQSGITSAGNYMVKKSTGKTIAEHAFNSMNKDVYKQSYFPEVKVTKIKIFPENKPVK